MPPSKAGGTALTPDHELGCQSHFRGLPLLQSFDRIATSIDVEPDDDWVPRYNIAPTQLGGRSLRNGRIAVLATALLVCIGLPEALVEGYADPVPSTPMEAALDALRSRFPDQLVVGFEELGMSDLIPSLRSILANRTRVWKKCSVTCDGLIRSTELNYSMGGWFMSIRQTEPPNQGDYLTCDYRNSSCRQTSAWRSRC